MRVSGAMKRHKQTAQGFLDGALIQNVDLNIQAGFNEFDHLEVLHRHKPHWERRAEMTKELASYPNPGKQFEYSFAAAIQRWVSGEYDADYVESWVQFQSRCWAAFQATISEALRYPAERKVKTVLVFTSGGTISAILGKVLQLSTRNTFAINEVLANTGVTRLLFSQQRVSLSYMNNYSHLDQPDETLLTYR